MSTGTSKKIGTHSGTFHADESLACFMLKHTEEFKNASIVRSRDPVILNELDVLVDVGGEYDHDRRRYDHHQRGFFQTFSEQFSTKLSSAGLIYKHYGKEIIAKIFQWDLNDPRLDIIYSKVYLEFFEAFDGIDNGISQYPKDIKPAYIDRTGISSRVGRLNPKWNQKGIDIEQQFLKAMEMVGQEFIERVLELGQSWLPAREIVNRGMNERARIDPSLKIIAFETACPWKQHLFDIEEEIQISENAKALYAIFPDEACQWRVQAIPIDPDSFDSRKPLPEPWRGLRDQALSDISGVPGCVFVHASGFIGGNLTKDGAIAMARLAIKA